MRLTRDQLIIGGAAYLIGFAAGVFAGYYGSKRRYEKLAQKDLEEAVIYEERITAMKSAGYSEAEIDGALPRVSTRVTNEERDKMIEKQLSEEPEEPPVDTDYPYVVPYETVFLELDDGYEDATLIWYEEDGVLADSTDDVLSDIDDLVGEANLQKFGHGSRDPNIVYIRNESMTTDFEIVRKKTSFSEEVLGKHLKHSENRAKRRARKFQKDEE